MWPQVLPILLFGCQSDGIEYISETLPSFSLIDVNPTSEFYESTIYSTQFVDDSPEKVSAWYFGHST